jgi:hypothetical protein
MHPYLPLRFADLKLNLFFFSQLTLAVPNHLSKRVRKMDLLRGTQKSTRTELAER